MRSLSYVARFAKTLCSERTNVVQVYLNATSGFQIGVAWLCGVRVRITSFRSDGRVPHSRHELLQRRLAISLIRRFSTDIVGVSPSTLDANMPNWRHDDRCQVIVNGFPGVTNRAQGSVDLRSLLPKPHAPLPIMAHVGRADIPSKNRERAILIAAKLNDLGAPHHLVFIGRHGANDVQAATNLRRWREIAQETGVTDLVHFLGERADVRDLIHGASCLLVTSSLEGLPGVIVESLLEDTPVISSNIPGALFLANKLPGIKCVSLDSSDDAWAETILGWQSTCSSEVRDGHLSKAVVRSSFNIQRQVRELRRLWSADAA